MLSISVILPTYNERDNVAPLLRRLHAVLRTRKHEIIVVDDRSPDGTASAVRALFKEIPPLRLVEPETRAGYSGALRLGMSSAHRDIIVSMDADQSYDPEDVERLIRRIEEGADLVIGSRHAQGAHYPAPGLRRKLKRIFSRFGNMLVPFMTGLRVTDCSANFRAMRRALWEELDCAERGKVFNLEIILRAVHLGKRVEEIPVSFMPRAEGRSKTNLILEAPRYALKLLRYAFLPM